MEKVFIERIKNSKTFTDDEINVIINNIDLYFKCYLLGIRDKIN